MKVQFHTSLTSPPDGGRNSIKTSNKQNEKKDFLVYLTTLWNVVMILGSLKLDSLQHKVVTNTYHAVGMTIWIEGQKNLQAHIKIEK